MGILRRVGGFGEKLFEKQTSSDAILEELSLMFGCTRHSLQFCLRELKREVGAVFWKL